MNHFWKMKNGKAAGYHCIVQAVTLILANGCVPDSFGESYMVPSPKI